MRLAAVLAVSIVLTLAQIIVSLTHAPAVPAGLTDIAAHGHAHGDEDRDYFPGHDAADHEHQLQALAVGPGDGPFRASGQLRRLRNIDHPSLPRDGPRRPPRDV